jgi:hypothetical protein
MTTTSTPVPATGALITSIAAVSPFGIVIRTVQPDREHAVLEVIGVPGHDAADELAQRVEGLLVAGVRYLLVDLSEAGRTDAVVDVLTEASRRLDERHGWLRVHGDRISPVSGNLSEATLTEVFAIYRAFDRSTIGRDALSRGHADISTPPPS